MLLTLSGNIVFKPDRGLDFKKKAKLVTLILDLPRYSSIPFYYINQLERELGPWSNLTRPMFGVHVTLVRGNADRFSEQRLATAHGLTMTVQADPRTLSRTPWSGTNPGFWTLDVVTPEPDQLRKKLGVKPIYRYEPHLTVAREGLDFFMHARAPVDPVRTARQALELIPERGGNTGLAADLRAFIKSASVDRTCTGDRLMSLVYGHVSFPSKAKAWEVQLVELFKHQGHTT